MLNIKILIYLLFFTSLCFGQEDITFELIKTPKKLTWVCTNHSSTQQKVTFTIKGRKGLRGYSKPVTKNISAGAEMEFLTVTHNGKYGFESTSWSYVANPTKEEKAQFEKAKLQYLDEKFPDLDQGIVVFEKEGCSRCQRSIAYLIDNNYDFKLINTSKNSDGNRKMWQLLKKNGYTSKKITMPVIIVNGKLSASHKDLTQFLNAL